MNAATRTGFLAALGAYFIWGLLPLYFKALPHIAPQEMLAHRILWSLPTGLILLLIANQWPEIRSALTWRRFGWLVLSSSLLAVNWFTYITAVGQARVMEASLGYFITPLVMVLTGVFLFRERLNGLQAAALALSALGVIIIGAAYGHVPYMALALCGSWVCYSIIRKQVQIDSRAGFTLEAAILFPLAAFWLWTFNQAPDGRLMGDGGLDIPLLILSGPITAFPLILFAIGARRLKLSTIGMMQYIGPSLQFLVALYLGEKFGPTHAAGFGCIWLALAIFSVDSLIREKQRAAA